MKNTSRGQFQKGFKRPQEWIENSRKLMTGDNNPSKRPEVRLKISQALKGRKGHPAWNKNLKGIHLSPKSEFKKGTKVRVGMKHTEEMKTKLSHRHMGKHFSPNTEFKKGMFVSEERKQLQREISLKLGIQPPHPSGEFHPNWKGGKSFEPYSREWSEVLKSSIRERDEDKCALCNEMSEDIEHDVHHIDYDKKNCNPDNLITLCHSCHPKTNFNREYWKVYFNNLMKDKNLCLQ